MVANEKLEKSHFIIIGEQKCGTSSLFKYLLQHPEIRCRNINEPNFFHSHRWDWNNKYPLSRIRREILFSVGKLPILKNKVCQRYFHTIGKQNGYKSIDHSPTYFSTNGMAKRIKNYLPFVKLIVMFRNPVDRLYSHFWMTKKQNSHNYVTFEEFIEKGKGWNRQFNKYSNNLQTWLKYFDFDQLFIIKSELFFKDTQNILNILFEYMQVSHYQIPDLSPQVPVGNKMRDYPPMDKNVRNRLEHLFKSEQEKLNKLTSNQFDWF